MSRSRVFKKPAMHLAVGLRACYNARHCTTRAQQLWCATSASYTVKKGRFVCCHLHTSRPSYNCLAVTAAGTAGVAPVLHISRVCMHQPLYRTARFALHMFSLFV